MKCGWARWHKSMLYHFWVLRTSAHGKGVEEVATMCGRFVLIRALGQELRMQTLLQLQQLNQNKMCGECLRMRREQDQKLRQDDEQELEAR